MSSILSVRHAGVSFDGHHVLRDVHLELAAGESLAVLGPNGAGKTVFLKALLGLVPFEGDITWAKEARIGYVPQKIDADRHLPINLRNLLEAKAHLLKRSRKEIDRVAKTAGLTADVLKTPVGHLSGGQFQKAMIAFALLGTPNVLLLDEPTASLDELAEAHVYELLHELRTEHGFTLIFVSHDVSMVPAVATKVLCLNKSAVCFGTPKQTLTPKIFAELFSAPHKYFEHVSCDVKGCAAHAHTSHSHDV